MVASLVLSLTDYDILSRPRFVGLANYRELASDPDVLRSLGTTVFYTALHVPLSLALALAVARLLSHRVMVMKGGRVIEPGLTAQVLDDPREAYTQLLVSSILPP